MGHVLLTFQPTLSSVSSYFPTFRRKLNHAGYECVYLDAPHLLPMMSTVKIDGKEVQITNGERKNAKAWFLYSKTDSADASMALKETPMEYIGLCASIQRVKECLMRCNNNHNNFCAILGFSQGATFCHVLSKLASTGKHNNDPDSDLNPFAKIRCAVLLSGFPSMHNGSLENITTKTTAHNNNKNNLIDLRSLHIFGEKDTSVPKSFGEKLANSFSDPETYDHGKGHWIPHTAVLCERVIDFLDSCSA
mmetsp:Transcript_18233/g.32616  ORF Transcript_18233/g.32616 Transcript_18233/m.32616 type:complete len:249 (-) Transcript_18233:18-764(-)